MFGLILSGLIFQRKTSAFKMGRNKSNRFKTSILLGMAMKHKLAPWGQKYGMEMFLPNF